MNQKQKTNQAGSIIVFSLYIVVIAATVGVLITFQPDNSNTGYWFLLISIIIAETIMFSLYWTPGMLRKWNPQMPTPLVIAWGSSCTVFSVLLFLVSIIFGIFLNYDTLYLLHLWITIFLVIALLIVLAGILISSRNNKQEV